MGKIKREPKVGKKSAPKSKARRSVTRGKLKNPGGGAQFLNSILESMDEGIVVVDKDFRMKFMNKYLLNWIKRTQSEVLGEYCYEIIHNRDDICPDCAVNKTFKSRKPEYACHTGLAKDGSKTYANLSSFPIFDEKGEVVLAVEKAVDVSREKKIVEALEESEERFRLIAENINEAFWMGDVKNEEIYYVSPAYDKVFGRPCESLYQNPRSFLDAAHPDDRPGLLEIIERQKTGAPTSLEYRVVLANGETRWVWDCRFPIREKDGGIFRFVGMAQDITPRKTAEEALSRISKAIEQSPDLVVITNAEGLVQYVNPAFSAFSGLSHQNAVGRPLPENYAEFGEVFSGDTEISDDSGESTAIHLTASHFLDEKGRPMGTVGVGVDITEQKRLQHKLFQSEKLVGLGTLASGIGHEINNPLAAILRNGRGHTGRKRRLPYKILCERPHQIRPRRRQHSEGTFKLQPFREGRVHFHRQYRFGDGEIPKNGPPLRAPELH